MSTEVEKQQPASTEAPTTEETAAPAATETTPNAGQMVPMMAARMRAVTDRWREHGFDVEMTDLWYAGDRNDVVDYLDARGWATSAINVAEPFAAQGLSLPVNSDGEDEARTGLHYVIARRPAPDRLAGEPRVGGNRRRHPG